MDRPTDQSLSIEQAKERLREAAGKAGLASYVRRRPYTSLAIACALGALLANSPATRDTAKRELLRFLFRAL